ncbi:MAG: MarR family transcriptional regulator [Clostridia bacterium]|nr:MarR family transcriptional regulator [Clostridia bacterium]
MKGLNFGNHDDFAICLNKMKYNMQKNMSDALKPYNLSSMHSLYIMALYHNGAMTLACLSKAVCFNRANTTRVIRDLIQKGYVFCDRQSESQRKFNVFLTDNGKKLANNLHQQMENQRKKQSSKLTKEEWDTLIFLMHKLVD